MSPSAACDPTQAINGLHPGFPVSITVPANVDVLIAIDGALQVNPPDTKAGYVSIYDNFLTIDDLLVDSAGQRYAFKRAVAAVNAIVFPDVTLTASTVAPWSATRRVTLPAGLHTLALCSAFAGGNAAGFFAGAKNSTVQSAVTVTFIGK